MLVFVLVQSFSLRSGASDTQAQDILKKMACSYEVNSYRGAATITEVGTGLDRASVEVSGTQEVTFKAPNRFAIRSSGDGVSGTQVRLSDGKEIVTFGSNSKQLSKYPVFFGTGSSGSALLLSLFGLSIDMQNGRMIGSSTIGGRPVYLVQTTMSVPPLRANATAEDRKLRDEFKKSLQPFELAIDKQDFRLLRVVQTLSDSDRQGRGSIVKTMEFSRQDFNPRVPDTLFSVANH